MSHVIVCEDCDAAVSVKYEDALITCLGGGEHEERYAVDDNPKYEEALPAEVSKFCVLCRSGEHDPRTAHRDGDSTVTT